MPVELLFVGVDVWFWALELVVLWAEDVGSTLLAVNVLVLFVVCWL